MLCVRGQEILGLLKIGDGDKRPAGKTSSFQCVGYDAIPICESLVLSTLHSWVIIMVDHYIA